MHDFGLNLQRLIDIPPKEPANFLSEGTFGLLSKEENEIIEVAYDYKAIADLSIKIIDGTEYKIGKMYEPLDISDWKFRDFLQNYKLIFHEYVPIAWQQKHRLEFINELYNRYYRKKFIFIKDKALWHNSSNFAHELNGFIEFKKLANRIAIKKFPIICIIKTKENDKNIDILIQYLYQQFEEKDFTLDVRSSRYEGSALFLAVKNQDILNYLALTLEDKWQIEAKIDYSMLNDYMDQIEKYIESSYLRQ